MLQAMTQNKAGKITLTMKMVPWCASHIFYLGDLSSPSSSFGCEAGLTTSFLQLQRSWAIADMLKAVVGLACHSDPLVDVK